MVLNKDLAKKLVLVSGIGWVMVASLVIGLFIGYYLDKWLKTSGAFTIIFLILGIIAGFYEAIRIIIKSTKEPPLEDKQKPHGHEE